MSIGFYRYTLHYWLWHKRIKININPQQTTNCLIVGAGLAGCLLAWRLDQAKQPFTLIGSTQLPNAWSVAAGLMNPVTGKWMTLSWNIRRLLPEAIRTYQAIEKEFAIQIYHPMPLHRYCQRETDVKRFGKRSRNPRYKNAFGPYAPPGSGPTAIIDDYGSFEIQHTAYIDLPKLITTLHHYFKQKGCFQDETFIHDELTAREDRWQYRNIDTARVIFCEGNGLSQNPWFSDLPLKPAKGETLILSSDSLQLPKAIYHHKKWVLPYGDGSFRLGATYDEVDLSAEPTLAGKKELLNGASSFIRPQHQFKVEQHLAGIRPGTTDARPLLGQHPNQANLYLLNGLGSKGASTAPEMSRMLMDFIDQKIPLDSEVDIARFL